MSLVAMKRGVAIALAWFTASCWAVQFTTTNFDVSPGKPFALAWEDATGPVELLLLTGAADELVTVEVIDAGDTGTSYTWTPPDDLPSGTYAFGISDGGDMNYSPQWEFEASDSAPASSPTTTTTKPPSTTRAPTTTAPSSTRTTTTTTTASDVATSTSAPSTTSSPNPAPTSSSPTGGSSSPSSPKSASNTSTSSSAGGAGGSDSDSQTTSTDANANPTPTPTPTPSPDPDSNSTPSSSSETKTPSPSSGLSTGAKAGIGAGAGIVGIALICLAGLFIFRRGKAAGVRQRRAFLGAGGKYNEESKAELGGDDAKPRAELGGGRGGGVAVAEMMHSDNGQRQRAELWQGHYDEWRARPSELDAGPRPVAYRGI